MFRNKDYIYKIYQERSFGKAAEKLHVSQPALSATVKRLENQLGMPIFNRTTTPISLTSFGAEYIKGIETVLDLEDHLHNLTYEIQTFQSGELTICAHNLSTDYRIPEMIASFKKEYPNIKLNIIGTNTIRAKQMLDSGEIDLFFSSKSLEERGYRRVVFSQEQLVLLVPKDFKINNTFKEKALTQETIRHIFSEQVEGVDLSQFCEVPFILSNSKNNLRSCTDTLFREAQVEPKIVLEVEESGISPNFARYGIGATISSHLLIERSDFSKEFCVYKLNSNYAVRTLYIYYRSTAYVTPAMQRFLEVAESK